MAFRWTNTLTHDDVTPRAAFLNRRQILAGRSGIQPNPLHRPAIVQTHRGNDGGFDLRSHNETTTYYCG